jgi:hypothetical protein
METTAARVIDTAVVLKYLRKPVSNMQGSLGIG